MPRRILLLPDDDGCVCDLCAAEHSIAIRRYVTRPHGYNYSSHWGHPLTPYRGQGEGKPSLSVKGAARIAGYANWLGVVYSQADNSPRGVKRAACLELPLKKVRLQLGVRIAGYDMDNMKPRQWCEANFPVFDVDEEGLNEFRALVDMLVLAADKAKSNLVGAVKEALDMDKADANKCLLAAVGDAFWARTEADFYAAAREIATHPDLDASEEARKAWRGQVMGAVRDLFEQETGVARLGRLKPEEYRPWAKTGDKLMRTTWVMLTKTLQLPKKGGD